MSIFFSFFKEKRKITEKDYKKLKIIFRELFLYFRSNRRWLILNIYLKLHTSFALGEFANLLFCHWVWLRNFCLPNHVCGNRSFGSPWQPQSPQSRPHSCFANERDKMEELNLMLRRKKENGREI